MLRTLSEKDAIRITTSRVIQVLASAVKELVENALDASATQIVDHGATMIEVSDNGHGIAEDDLDALGALFHTSKLSNADDLAYPSAFGFRGEALASLADISESLTIITSTATTTPKAAKIVISSGKKDVSTSLGARQKGTTVIVKNLFANLPVRRQELKRQIRKEYAKTLDMIKCLAVGATETRFTLKLQTGQGRPSLAFSTALRNEIDDKLESRFAEVYDVDATTMEHISIKDDSAPFSVKGLISKPFSPHSPKKEIQVLFVNKRLIKHSKISSAINQAYRQQSQPLPNFCLYLNVSDDKVDVNVSSDKMDVFLHDEDQIVYAIDQYMRDFLMDAQQTFSQPEPSSFLRQASLLELLTPASHPINEHAEEDVKEPVSLVHTISSPIKRSFSDMEADIDNVIDDAPALVDQPANEAQPNSSEISTLPDINLSVNIKDIIQGYRQREGYKDCKPQREQSHIRPVGLQSLAKTDFVNARVVGQFNKGFIIAHHDAQQGTKDIPMTAKGCLYIVDQHAGDEKYWFETLLRRRVPTHRLIRELPVELSLQDVYLVEQHRECFKRLGYVFETPTSTETESRCNLVRVIQKPIDANDVSMDIHDILGQLKSGIRDSDIFLTRTRKACASKACRSAIMIGDALDTAQQIKVVRQLEGLENPWQCPHGRPTVKLLATL